MHDCTPNLTACHSVLRSGGEAICLQHAHTYDSPASEMHTHASHILCVRGRVGYNELVPSRLSAKVSQWCCLRESNVRHANRCGLSASARTHMRTPARFPMHEEWPLGPDWTARVHGSVHPCPFHLHSSCTCGSNLYKVENEEGVHGCGKSVCCCHGDTQCHTVPWIHFMSYLELI